MLGTFSRSTNILHDGYKLPKWTIKFFFVTIWMICHDESLFGRDCKLGGLGIKAPDEFGIALRLDEGEIGPHGEAIVM